MKKIILIFFIFYLIDLLQRELVGGMESHGWHSVMERQGEHREGKQVMEGSSGGYQNAHQQIYLNPQEFSLVELTILIEILKKIEFDWLLRNTPSNEIFVEYCSDYIKNVTKNKFSYNIYEGTCWKIGQVVVNYHQMLTTYFNVNLNVVGQNTFITWNLFVFVRMLIRSFFVSYKNYHYDVLFEQITQMNKNISILRYLEAHDDFEVKAKDWMVKMEEEQFFEKTGIPLMSLKEFEGKNIIYHVGITSETYLIQEFIDLIYQYDDIDEDLTNGDCVYIAIKRKKSESWDESKKRKDIQYFPFYKYFYELDEMTQRKIQKYILTPFLTDEVNNGYAIFKYLQITDKIKKNKNFPPQPHFEMSKLIRDYCGMLRYSTERGSSRSGGDQMNMDIDIWGRDDQDGGGGGSGYGYQGHREHGFERPYNRSGGYPYWRQNIESHANEDSAGGFYRGPRNQGGHRRGRNHGAHKQDKSRH